jgi:hypothetical protein
MSKPLTPNYVPGVGRLTTYRLQLENHVNGTEFRQNATTIDLEPNLEGFTTVQEALAALISDFPPVIPSATVGITSSNLGLITLGGDLSGVGSTALTPRVGALQGRPVQNLTPTTGQVLAWNGSAWGPASSSGSVPGGPAGGDLGGTYPNPTVLSVAHVTTGVLPAANQAPQTLVGNVTGTTAASVVSAISGASPILITPAILEFTAGTVSPTITQASTTSSPAATFTISAQSTTGPAGGSLFLSAGSGATESGVISLLITGGSPLLLLGNENGLQYGQSFTPITLAATGTTTLTSSQLQFPYLSFTGSITDDIIIDFGSAIIGANWIVDTTAVTFGGNTIQLRANGITGSTMVIANDTSLYQVTCGGIGALYGIALGPF